MGTPRPVLICASQSRGHFQIRVESLVATDTGDVSTSTRWKVSIYGGGSEAWQAFRETESLLMQHLRLEQEI